jgi:hypothetical protein
MPKPLCFVLMPFGKKPSGSGGIINFDAIYVEMIKPAIEAAGMEPIRADEEYMGGICSSQGPDRRRVGVL